MVLHTRFVNLKQCVRLHFMPFLRIGELTATKKACPQPLQLHQIAHVRDSQHNVIGINLTFLNFKHNYNQRPFTLLINRQATCCPIALLLEYIAPRGNRAGLLFITQAGGLLPGRILLRSCPRQFVVVV
jgi:hypothetical protein